MHIRQICKNKVPDLQILFDEDVGINGSTHWQTDLYAAMRAAYAYAPNFELP